MVTEHPVLLPYISPTASLYLNRFTGSRKSLIADLIEAHADCCGAWLHPYDFLRLDIIRPDSEPSFGLLATAPTDLLHRYQDAVVQNGGNASIAGKCRMRKASEGPVAGLLLGDCWIVAIGFTAERCG